MEKKKKEREREIQIHSNENRKKTFFFFILQFCCFVYTYNYWMCGKQNSFFLSSIHSFTVSLLFQFQWNKLFQNIPFLFIYLFIHLRFVSSENYFSIYFFQIKRNYRFQSHKHPLHSIACDAETNKTSLFATPKTETETEKCALHSLVSLSLLSFKCNFFFFSRFFFRFVSYPLVLLPNEINVFCFT